MCYSNLYRKITRNENIINNFIKSTTEMETLRLRRKGRREEEKKR